jgi:hypothetical protein
VSRYALSLLLTLNLALAGVLAWLWFTPEGALRDLRWQPPQPVPPALASAKPLPSFGVDINRFVATLERPLFVPSRRPPPKPEDVAAAPPPPPDPLPNIRLLGLYGNDAGGGMIANVNGKVRRVHVGDAVAGNWRLKALRGNEVVVARGDEERTVELVRNNAAAPEPQPAVAAGAADAAATSAAAANASADRDLERRRDQVRRMNAARARRGIPLLPEP